MPNTAAEARCANCGALRAAHGPDAEGLRLVCADGGRFAWPRTKTRASMSMNRAELQALANAVTSYRARRDNYRDAALANASAKINHALTQTRVDK